MTKERKEKQRNVIVFFCVYILLLSELTHYFSKKIETQSEPEHSENPRLKERTAKIKSSKASVNKRKKVKWKKTAKSLCR